MFILCALILLFSIYVAPALAVYPKLLLDPLKSACIPILSLLIILLVFLLLISFSWFTQLHVILITIAFIIVAISRVIYVIRNYQLTWEKQHLNLLLLNLAIVLPIAAAASASSFSTNDEIYSWGMWATQIFHGQALDLHVTGAFYPPLLSIILAYGFKLLGSTELQASAKICLIIFPFTILQLIAYLSVKTRTLLPLYLLIIAIGVFPPGFYFFYSKAYADPMMTAALLTSVSMYFMYQLQGKLEYLVLSIVAAIVAIWSKQPALIWSGIILPLLVFHSHRTQKKFTITEFGLVFFLILATATFAFITLHGFWANHEVIIASMQNRGYLEQLIYASNIYLVHQPYLLLLFIVTGFLAVKYRDIRWVYYLFTVPGIILWFILGAYQLRLGIYLTSLCVLLIAKVDYGYDLYRHKFIKLQNHFQNNLGYYAQIAILLSIVITSGLSVKWIYFSDYEIYTLQGGRTTINNMFGKDGTYIHQRLYDKNIKLWIANPFAYGVFLNHAKIVHPSYQNPQALNITRLWQELKQQKPDYLISSGRAPSMFPKLLDKLAEQCPMVFVKVAVSTPRYGFNVYRFNLKNLDQCNRFTLLQK